MAQKGDNPHSAGWPLYKLKGSTRPLPFVEDVAVPPEALPEFLTRMQNVLKRHQVTASLFGHAGQGQLHIRPFLDLANQQAKFGDPLGVKKYPVPTTRGYIYPVGTALLNLPMFYVGHGMAWVGNGLGADIPMHGYTERTMIPIKATCWSCAISNLNFSKLSWTPGKPHRLHPLVPIDVM